MSQTTTHHLSSLSSHQDMWTARVSGREHMTSLSPKEAVTLVYVANQG